VRFDHSAVAAAKTHKLVKCDAEAADSIVIDATLPRVNNKRNLRQAYAAANLKLRLAEPTPHALPLATGVDAECVENLRAL
jgi:hypothetical protein